MPYYYKVYLPSSNERLYDRFQINRNRRCSSHYCRGFLGIVHREQSTQARNSQGFFLTMPHQFRKSIYQSQSQILHHLRNSKFKLRC